MKIPIIQLNQDTGLPPESKALEQEGSRLNSIQEAAEKAQQLVAEANSHSRFPCDVNLPDEILGCLADAWAELADLIEYSRCVQEIEKDLSAGKWAQADECFRQAPDLEFSWKLHLALKIGLDVQQNQPPERRPKLRWLQTKDLSHPVLAVFKSERANLEREFFNKDQLRLQRMTQAARVLCGPSAGTPTDDSLVSWLTSPILCNHSFIKGLVEAVGKIDEAAPTSKGVQLRGHINSLLDTTPGETALQAAAGDLQPVIEALRNGIFVPHNLAVAVFARLREDPEDRSAQEYLSGAISACALFACCYEYREKVAAQLHRALPPGIRPKDRDVRSRVFSALEQLFKEAGIAWGLPTQAESWRCQWEVECSAVTQLALKGERLGDNSFPLGPALVQFYKLQEKLAQVLKKYPEIRPWYGPCGNSTVVLWAGDPHGALQSLEGMTTLRVSKAHLYPGYSTLPNPQEALKNDAGLVYKEIWFALLNLYQFKAGTSSTEAARIAAEIGKCCNALIEVQDSGIELADRLARALRDSFITREIKAEEDAQTCRECMTRIIDVLAAYNTAARPWLQSSLGILKLKRAELTLKLADIRFAAWDGSNRKALEDLAALVDLGLADSPADPTLNVRRAEVALLFALVDKDVQRNKVDEILDHLRTRMTGGHWPSWAISEVMELGNYRDMIKLAQRLEQIRRARVTEE